MRDDEPAVAALVVLKREVTRDVLSGVVFVSLLVLALLIKGR